MIYIIHTLSDSFVRTVLSGTFSVWDKPAAWAGLEFAPGYYQKKQPA
jgi:hypothetical protein